MPVAAMDRMSGMRQEGRTPVAVQTRSTAYIPVGESARVENANSACLKINRPRHCQVIDSGAAYSLRHAPRAVAPGRAFL